ncbi:collagen alpha-1(I) chain-like [Varanus komodoensis]|uniref:collagen alpha-1(I) chain-like n=1 Tax=Varanus komodoensis TaxID=61221 RepID=UPI001CF795BB|nr:collagen alpha-1(I) chain-like [Varanus komodoensis]
MRPAERRSGAAGRAPAARSGPRSEAGPPQEDLLPPGWEEPAEQAAPGAPTHHPRPSRHFLKQQPREPAPDSGPVSHNPPLRGASGGRPNALLMRLALIEDRFRRRRISAPPRGDDGSSASEPSCISEPGATGPGEDSDSHAEEARAAGGDQPGREQDDGRGNPSGSKAGEALLGAQADGKRSPPSAAWTPPESPDPAGSAASSSSPDRPSSAVADGLTDSSVGSEPGFGARLLSLPVDDGTDSEISELLSAYSDDFEPGPSSPAPGGPGPSSLAEPGPRTKDAAVQTSWAPGDAARHAGRGGWGPPEPDDLWGEAPAPPSPTAAALDDLLLQLLGLIRDFAQHSRRLRDSAVASLEEQELRYQYQTGTLGPGGPHMPPREAGRGPSPNPPHE